MKNLNQLPFFKCRPRLITPQHSTKKLLDISTTSLAPTQSTKRIHTLQSEIKKSIKPNKLSLYHESIMKSMKYMNKEILNSLNLLHYQDDPPERKLSIDLVFRELEYDIITTSQTIENEIFNKLLYIENYEQTKDEIGKEFEGRQNFYKQFHLKMMPQLIEIMNPIIFTLIKLLHLKQPNLCTSAQNLWKMLIFMVDLSLQSAYDRNNYYIQQSIADTKLQLQETQRHADVIETKFIHAEKEHEQKLIIERTKNQKLQEQYEDACSQVYDLQKLRDEDVLSVANGGIFYLKKSLNEMNRHLFQLDSTLKNQQKDIKIGLTEVGQSMVRKLKLNETTTALKKLRDVIGIDLTQQSPGDIAYGNLVSEHPWLPILQLKNLMPYSVRTQDQIAKENKLLIIHQFLLSPCLTQTSGAQQFIQLQDNRSFTELISSLIAILVKSRDEIINQIVARLFNIYGLEGLPIYNLNRVKQFYSFIVKKITGYFEVKSPRLGLMCTESARRINAINKLPIEQIFYLRLTLRLYDLLIIENSIKHFPELNLCDSYLKDMTLGNVLQLIMDQLVVNDRNNFKLRKDQLKSQLKLINRSEDFIKKSVAVMIAEDVFREYYQLDKDKIWNYLIWRYYILFEKQIKFDISLTDLSQEVVDYRYSFLKSNITTESTAEIFMEATLKKIRAMLIFCPQSFSGSDIKLNNQDQQSEKDESGSSIQIVELNQIEY